jgi:hypothetical protein
MSSIRSKRWFITLNNPSEEERLRCLSLLENQERYMLVEEVGELGTPHFHLFIEFRTSKSFVQVKKQLPRADLEISHGTLLEVRNYLNKGGNIIKEFNMLDRRSFMGSTNLQEFSILHPQQFLAHLNNARQIFNNFFFEDNAFTTRKPIKVFWFHGPTGSGKTWAACDEIANLVSQGHRAAEVVMPRNELWFDGIDSMVTVVLMDDFRASNLQYHKLLRLLDGRPLRVEVKGSFSVWCPQYVFITCSLDPYLCYSGITEKEGIDQLIRRITEIRDFSLVPYEKVIDAALGLIL